MSGVAMNHTMNKIFPFGKELIQLAWPLIIANSFWNLQLTIDRIFLGMYSTEALGAAMAVMGVFWVPMALLQQTASYVTSFVAQFYGAKEYNSIGKSFWNSIYISCFGGILFLGLNWISPWFFSVVGHSESIQKIEVEYFNTVAYCALPTALVAAISGFFTGLGQTRTVIWINLVGLVLNVILDYVMIFGHFGFPAWGVAGAGYATALATLGSALFGLYLIVKSSAFKEYGLINQWSLDFSLLKQYLKYGLPSGMQWALEGLAFTVFLIVMGRLKNGEAALASSSIAVTIMMLSVLPAMGLAQAVMTLLGQSIGEKNTAKAQTVTYSGVKISVVYMLMMGLSFILFPQFYLSWFKNESNLGLWSAVSVIVPSLLVLVSVFTLFDSVYLNISFALKGAGDTRFVSLVALILPWPLMVVPAYLVKDWDHAVIWAWSFVAVYSLTSTLILFLRFKKGAWKSMSLLQS